MTDLTQAPPFSKYEVFGPGFDRSRQQIATQWASIDIDLGAAMPQSDGLMLNIAGDVIYVDAASTGIATLDLNVQQSAAQAPFLAQSGLVLYGIFVGVKVRWTVQAGLILRLFYATDHRVIPANSGSNEVSSWTAPQTVVITPHTAIATLDKLSALLWQLMSGTYKATSNMTGNTPDVVFSVAANVNGAVIHRASGWSMNGTGPTHYGLLAGPTTPTSIGTSNEIIALTDTITLTGANYHHFIKLERPLRIPAGYGLWWLAGTTETSAARMTSYVLL